MHTISSDNDSQSEETPLSVHMYELFREKLFHYPYQEASEEELNGLLEHPTSMTVLFYFLTLIHQ